MFVRRQTGHRPKRETSPFGHVIRAYVDIPLDARDAAYSVDLKSRKMDTRNGVTRQRLSAVAVSATCGAGDQAGCLTGGMSQEANAPGNTGDMLTWDRPARRRRGKMSPGLRHTLRSSVVKTGRKSSSDCADAKLRERAIAHNGVPMTKARVTEEPDEGKALMSGSVVAVRGATPSPTITQSDAAPRPV